jgi:hypothetical protein
LQQMLLKIINVGIILEILIDSTEAGDRRQGRMIFNCNLVEDWY